MNLNVIFDAGCCGLSIRSIANYLMLKFLDEPDMFSTEPIQSQSPILTGFCTCRRDGSILEATIQSKLAGIFAGFHALNANDPILSESTTIV